MGKTMHIEGNNAYITRYEVIDAFFRTEEEENLKMAMELNKMINSFCEQERYTKRNVALLPFDIGLHKDAIEYIRQVSLA